MLTAQSSFIFWHQMTPKNQDAATQFSLLLEWSQNSSFRATRSCSAWRLSCTHHREEANLACKNSLGCHLILPPPQNVTDRGGSLKYGVLRIGAFPRSGSGKKLAVFVSHRAVRGMKAERQNWQDEYIEKVFSNFNGLFCSDWWTQGLFLSVCFVPE